MFGHMKSESRKAFPYQSYMKNVYDYVLIFLNSSVFKICIFKISVVLNPSAVIGHKQKKLCI